MLYLRDPQETELGRKIVTQGVRMIDDLGFEQFTFKKLATEIDSTEPSIYRYFQNKHKLLVYLISWYWVWLYYRITFHTNNIKNPKERLKIIFHVLSEVQKDDPDTEIDEAALHRIVVNESAKAYLTKEVDSANKHGLYGEYKKLCKKIAEIIHEINPTYPYAHSLVSMLIEASHHQTFFAQHLPSLTDIKIVQQDYSQLEKYLEHILFSAIENA
jgi:AcrR family transcriptional regulator